MKAMKIMNIPRGTKKMKTIRKNCQPGEKWPTCSLSSSTVARRRVSESYAADFWVYMAARVAPCSTWINVLESLP